MYDMIQQSHSRAYVRKRNSILKDRCAAPFTAALLQQPKHGSHLNVHWQRIKKMWYMYN